MLWSLWRGLWLATVVAEQVLSAAVSAQSEALAEAILLMKSPRAVSSSKRLLAFEATRSAVRQIPLGAGLVTYSICSVHLRDSRRL